MQRWSAWVLLCLAVSLPAVAPVTSALHDDRRAPVFLRADEVHGVEGGAFLLHAGNERPARVEVTGAGLETASIRSTAQWTRHAYPIPDDGRPVQVETRGPVWLVPLVEQIEEGRQVELDCSDVGTHLFWSVLTEEVRMSRDEVDAPRARFFTPAPGMVVPDEVAVLDHTMLLEAGEAPLYLEVVADDATCTGILVLTAGPEPGASPLAAPLDDLFWALFVAALVIGGVLSAIWWVGLRRDRRRRQAAVVL